MAEPSSAERLRALQASQRERLEQLQSLKTMCSQLTHSLDAGRALVMASDSSSEEDSSPRPVPPTQSRPVPPTQSAGNELDTALMALQRVGTHKTQKTQTYCRLLRTPYTVIYLRVVRRTGGCDARRNGYLCSAALYSTAAQLC